MHRTCAKSTPRSGVQGFGHAENPCSRAASAAVAHNASGIGSKPLCPFRRCSKRRQILRMANGNLKRIFGHSRSSSPLGVERTLPISDRGSHAALPEAPADAKRSMKGIPHLADGCALPQPTHGTRRDFTSRSEAYRLPWTVGRGEVPIPSRSRQRGR
jgi:hypothetical protein